MYGKWTSVMLVAGALFLVATPARADRAGCLQYCNDLTSGNYAQSYQELNNCDLNASDGFEQCNNDAYDEYCITGDYCDWASLDMELNSCEALYNATEGACTSMWNATNSLIAANLQSCVDSCPAE